MKKILVQSNLCFGLEIFPRRKSQRDREGCAAFRSCAILGAFGHHLHHRVSSVVNPTVSLWGFVHSAQHK